ncbi:MAG TPA: carotenoid oxygenase family protein [Myxococcota bacterium]|nr:carotenoid oxygenase family protein [Myxococcota bacterium]
MSRPFPTDDPTLSGPWQPWPMEGEVHDCAVRGEIPRDLRGTLYRNGPNPQFAPRASYHFFTGDGMIHAFRFEDGRCHYRNRWVRTPRFVAERGAGEALFGNLFGGEPDDARAKGVAGGPANTNIVWHGGRLLALVEGGLPPVELDPVSLDTRRVFDFDGRLRRPIDPGLAKLLGLEAPDGTTQGTFTAHPKIDPESGEMLAFGYSAIAPYLMYYVVSADGKLTRCEPIEVPFPSMVHDFIATRDHVIFPIFPATLRPERMARGESVLGWEPDLGTRVGVMPRGGHSDDVVWLQTDPCYVFHPMNARGEGARIVAELAQYPRLPLALPGEERHFEIGARLVRWTLDLDGGTVKQEALDDRVIEFPRLDERRSGLTYRYGFAGSGSRGAVHGMNQIVRYDLDTGAAQVHGLGERDAANEPVFVPRRADAPEGQGYLLSVVWRGDEDRSDLLVLDAENVDREPLATVRLPHRVPNGFHGNWRPAH